MVYTTTAATVTDATKPCGAAISAVSSTARPATTLAVWAELAYIFQLTLCPARVHHGCVGQPGLQRPRDVRQSDPMGPGECCGDGAYCRRVWLRRNPSEYA